ncbi:MAG: hypothetical protein ACRDGM_00125 [bacterium]
MTDTDTLIEAMARAIGEQVAGPGAQPRGGWIKAAHAALRGIHEADWVVVPKEPTEEMLKAGWAKWRAGIERDCLKEEYQAMLAAAPDPLTLAKRS